MVTQVNLIPMPEVNEFSDLRCPMPPGCGSEIWVKYDAYSWIVGANYNSGEAPALNDFFSLSWKVECQFGHVLLVPTEYVDCDDEDSVESDEYRIFTDKDMKRLIQVLKLLNADWESVDV